MNISALAQTGFQETRPQSAKLHLFGNEAQTSILDVEGGRLWPLSLEQGVAIDMALRQGDTARAEFIAMGFGLLSPPPEKAIPPKKVPLKALSLAIAQKCNLGCTYCYAQQGSFGGKASNMADPIMQASIDKLLEDAQPGETVTLAFMGGEPLTNRKTLHDAAHYGARSAAAKKVGIGFTLTTNATLLQPKDIELFQNYQFTITVSIDGIGAVNDQTRPYASGKGSFNKVAQNMRTLLEVKDRRYRLLARVTVTPKNLDLAATMIGLLKLGFDGIMFSPMLSAPSGQEEMQAGDFDKLLAELKSCGKVFREALNQETILPFSNIITTLKRIHTYKQDQYPCGAGGGYMGVSAKGELYACHRFVDDEQGHMGSVDEGIAPDKQSNWLKERHLQNQSPCTECWARYLCSGSCHYETIKRGRPACDYIRGWLHYCLSLYGDLAREQPDMLKRVLN